MLSLRVLHSKSLIRFWSSALVAGGPRPIGLGKYFAQGAVAQLGERLICIQEVAGSIPTSSTSLQRAGL
jgi:hypothetical protein